MEIVRRATPHVRRRGWQASLKVICDASAMKIWECMKSVNDKAGLGDIIRNKSVHSDLRHALQEMMYFTSEVIGTDGARQKLRHEQMGDMLRFGAVGGFLTPNVADTRRPLMVVIHAGVLNGTPGGLREDGSVEKYDVDLLDEKPSMPSATEMLKIVARNPVAQARFSSYACAFSVSTFSALVRWMIVFGTTALLTESNMPMDLQHPALPAHLDSLHPCTGRSRNRRG